MFREGETRWITGEWEGNFGLSSQWGDPSEDTVSGDESRGRRDMY